MTSADPQNHGSSESPLGKSSRMVGGDSSDGLARSLRNGCDENRNVAFFSSPSSSSTSSTSFEENRKCLSVYADNGHPNASWPGTLSPPDSMCCVSPSVGSPESGAPPPSGLPFGSNVRSPATAMAAASLSCISVAPVVFYSTATAAQQSRRGCETGFRPLFSSFPCSATLHGVHGVVVSQGVTANVAAYRESTPSAHGGVNQHAGYYPPVVSTPVRQSSEHLWNTPVQCHMINGVTFDICLTPSPDNSASF